MKKISRLKSLVISYIIMFFIPVAAIGLFFSAFFIQRYKSEQLESCTKSVKSIVNAVNERFTAYNNLITQLQYDEKMLALKNDMPVLKMIEAQNRLQAYKLVNGQIEEITLIYRQTENIISSKTAYNPKTFLVLAPKCKNLTAQELYKGCLTLQEPKWYNAATSGGQECALGIYPIPSSIGGKYGTVLLTVDMAKFTKDIFTAFPYSNSFIRITEKGSNEIIITDAPDKKFSSFTQTKQGLIAKEQDGEEYVVFIEDIPLSSLEVQVYVSKEKVFWQYQRFFTALFIMMSIILVIGILFIFFLSKSYRNTAKLLRKAMSGLDSGNEQADELSAAVSSIENLKIVMLSLENNLSNSQQIITDLEKYRIDIKETLLQNNTGDKTPVELSTLYANEHFTEYDFTVNAMAQSVNMNGSAFTQQFKKEMGISPLQYIANLRINLAKELLVSTKLPVNEIIYRVGYSDTSAFIRKFKSQIGITPGKFREWYMNDSNANDSN